MPRYKDPGSKDDDSRYNPQRIGSVDLRYADDADRDAIDSYGHRPSDDWASEPKSETPIWVKIGIGGVSVVIVISLLAGLAGPFLGESGKSSDAGVEYGYEYATVTDVLDERTIVVDIDGELETVRYIGVDASDMPLAWRDMAIRAHRDLVQDAEVILEADDNDRDDRGRLLRYVYLERNMVNGLLLRNGLGRLSDPNDGNDRYYAEMASWSDAARVDRIGIWSESASDGTGASRSY